MRQVEEQLQRQREQEERAKHDRRSQESQQRRELAQYFLDFEEQEHFNEDTCGFNEEELFTAVKVIRALTAAKPLLKHEKMRPVRKALRGFLGFGEDKQEFARKFLTEANLDSQVVDLCCEIRVKKNNEKLVVRQQLAERGAQPRAIMPEAKVQAKNFEKKKLREAV